MYKTRLNDSNKSRHGDGTTDTIANSLLRLVFRLKITILTKHITPSMYMTNQNEILKKKPYRNNKHKSKQRTSITQFAC